MQETWVWSLDQEDIPWRKKWQPTLVFLPEKSHGQRSLVDPSPWSCRRVRHHWATKQQQPWCHLAWDFRWSLRFGWRKEGCVQNLTRSLKLPALLILDVVWHAGGIFQDQSVFLWHCLWVKHNTVVFIPRALGPSFLQSSPSPWELGKQNLQLSGGCQMAVAAEDSVQYKHRQWCWLNSESVPGAILPSSSQSLGS